MFASERQKAILVLIKKQGSVKSLDLAEQFHTSLATIRRDLDVMQQRGLVQRVYGGATPIAPDRPTDQYFNNRVDVESARKRAIGKAAAAYIHEGETIFLDIGTTVLEVARSIRGLQNLTVITCSLPVLNELVDTNVKVYSVGGRLRPKERALIGLEAAETLKKFCVDKAIVCAGGVSVAHGITDYNFDSAALRKQAIERAGQSILVADSTKFGVDVFAVVCAMEAMDVIVTDDGLDPAYERRIRAGKTKLDVVSLAGFSNDEALSSASLG